MKYDWRGGVLVVGSLLWDDDGCREEWRNRWLSIDDARRVIAPIRYGRLSKGRGCTYTMVFSRACRRAAYAGGVGVAVAFKAPMDDAESLAAAAHALWGAEKKESNSGGRLGASWGAVGLLANPQRDASELLAAWKTCVVRQPCYSAPSHLKSEGAVLDEESGRLLIPWPHEVVGGPLNLDFLLATATDPELMVPGQRYPSAARIAAAWIADRDQKARSGQTEKQEVKYFLENRKHGISTFQDDRIRAYLLGAGIESV